MASGSPIVTFSKVKVAGPEAVAAAVASNVNRITSPVKPGTAP